MVITELIGKTLIEVKGNEGDEEIIFTVSDSEQYKLLHYQDCCEHVRVEEIIGDLNDLVGSPILTAEERTRDAGTQEVSEEGTWTFYELATNKGSVTIRWLGESNGYYSESVDFVKVGASRW